jgi:amino acid transporter
VVVGSMIGSGIFRSPADIAALLPGPLPLLLVWAVGGLVALCGALTLSEVGGAFPYSGGLYVYIREAYGRLPSFLFGWSNLILQPASNGAVALVFSQYALRLAGILPGSPGFDTWAAGVAIAALIVVTAANVLGVRFGSLIQNLTTLAKTGGLAALILLSAFIAVPKAGAHFVPMVPSGSFTLSAFGLALVPVLFACDGWMNLCYISGEVKDPHRSLPRAIVLGVVIVIVIYLLANVSYLAVFPVSEMQSKQIIAADAMSKLVGGVGVTFIVGTVMFSTFGALNAGVLSSPRIYFAMAEDRVFFTPLASVHPRYHTPHVAVIVCGVMAIAYVLTATAMRGSKAFGALIDATVVGNLPFYALGVASIFVFRRRSAPPTPAPADEPANTEDSLLDPVTPGHSEAHAHVYRPPVRAPLYPLTPIVFLASMVFLLANSLMHEQSRIPSVAVLLALAAGAPLYACTIGRRSGSAGGNE